MANEKPEFFRQENRANQSAGRHIFIFPAFKEVSFLTRLYSPLLAFTLLTGLCTSKTGGKSYRKIRTWKRNGSSWKNYGNRLRWYEWWLIFDIIAVDVLTVNETKVTWWAGDGAPKLTASVATSWALVLMTASVYLVSNCISLVLFLVIEFSLNTAIFPLFLRVVCWRSENMGDGYVRKWSDCEELWRLRNRWSHFVVINGSNKWSNGDIGFEDYRKEREVFRKNEGNCRYDNS